MRESNETYIQLVATYEKKFNKSPWALQCPIRCNIKHSFDNFETFSDKINFNLRLVEHDLNWTNIRPSYDFFDVIWTSYVPLI